MDVPKYSRIQKPWRRWDVQALRRNLGVYVHVPFCQARCRYCNFLTFGRSDLGQPPMDEYGRLLLDEIQKRGEWASAMYGARGRAVDTVFIGGGTPTFLAIDQLVPVIEALLRHFPVDRDNIEFTVEANPETLSARYVSDLAKAGVNRLSVGVQATQERLLRFLGRTHRWADIEPVLADVRAGPIRNVSLDLIYSVPGQTPADVADSLRQFMRFKPSQVSTYELAIEAGTPLENWAKRHPGQLVPDVLAACQQQRIERYLASAGLYRYEVCSYAQPGRECRHNLRYWIGGDYIGLGLGAASRVNNTVYDNPRKLGEYSQHVHGISMRDDPVANLLEAPNYADEAPPADLFMQLRTRRGIEIDVNRLDPAWIARDWIRLENGCMEMTSKGLNFADLMARQLS